MKKTYKFTFDTETEKDVIQVLESVPRLLRSQYIVEVIRFTKSKLLECSLGDNSSKEAAVHPMKQDESDATKQEQNPPKKKFDISKLLGGL